MNILEFIRLNGQSRSLKSTEHLFEMGDSTNLLHFIQKGLLKAYYISNDGKEYVKSFIQEGDFITSLAAVYQKEHATFSLKCLSDCEVISIEFDVFADVARNDLEFANFMNDNLLKLAMKKEKREYELLCLSAENRGRKLCDEHPYLINKVTQNDLAKYLGITPVALSRIRRRLAEQY